MAIIYSYPITTPQDSDLFIISRVPDDPDEISNFSVGVGTIAEYIIDKLIDPNAFDFQIPVFNQGGNRITGSIMSQDSSPSNGVAGTKITIAGNTTTTGDVQIDTLTNNFIPVNSDSGVLRDSVIYQETSANQNTNKAVALNTSQTGTNYGSYPDLRVASRQNNDFAVLDLFRRDNNVTAGENVGMLQYSVEDDGRYVVAQISAETLATTGSGDSGGGKFVFKTSQGGSVGPSGNTPESRFTLDYNSADFSVPLNVTNNAQSSFAGQVTIPLTPIQNTDAASKGYVDSQLDKDLQIEGDTGTGSINLDTQVFDVAGGTYIDTAAGGQTITVDISAVDGNPGVNERYLTKNNTWAEVATIPGTYRFNVNADSGTAQTVNTTETLLLAGGTYINTSVGAGIGPEVTFNHDDTTLTTTSSSSSPGVGGSFSVIDSITTNLQGHVTEINTLTVTLPQDVDNYVEGSGTVNTIPLWTGSQVLSDSIITQVGTSSITISGNINGQAGIEGESLTIHTGPSTITGELDKDGSKITNLADPTAAQDAATKAYVDSQTDNYVDGGAYSSATGILTLSRTGGLADVTASGFLQLGATSTTALAGDTTTITQTQANDIVANNAKVSFPEAPTDGQQYARQNAGWSVVSGGGGGVGGSGTTNTLPIWSDGPLGVLGDSGISETRNVSGNISDIIIATDQATNPLNVNFGSGGATSFKQGTTEFIKLTDDNSGFYTANFRYASKLTVDRDGSSNNPSLDVGASDHTYPAAWFRNGVVVSNNPSGVSVDNTSMVIGAGNNDNVSGSDHCLIVGSNNQVTSNSDQSVAFGQGNAITSSTDAFAAGNSNSINTSLRTQAFGFNNTVNSASSFIAGGDNSVTALNNAFILGYDHVVTGSSTKSFLFGQNITLTGGQSNYAIGTNLDAGAGEHMVIGYRNYPTGYPTPNKNLGLGDTKFIVAVGSGTVTPADNNAVIITEGGVNGGSSGTVPQVPRVILPTVPSFSASNDAAADALGVPQGALYQNQGVVQINRGGGSTTDPLAGGGGNYTIDVINSNTVGQKNYLYVLTGGSAITLTMPSSPSSGDSIKVVNLTTVTTCVIAQGGSPIMGVGQDMTLDNNKANFELVYTDATRGWVVVGATGEI